MEAIENMQMGLNPAMNSIAERAAAARKFAGMTQKQAETASGVKQSDISKIERGDTERPAGLLALARAYDVDPNWLDTGDGPAPWVKAHTREPQPEYAGTRGGVRRVPVVGTARMGDDGFYEEISSMPGAGDGHIEIATSDENAYCLRVRGNSMAPAIRDGWYVLVEPNGTPAVGEYVVLKLFDGRKMVKELLFQRANSVEIMSVNGEERRTLYPDELEAMQAVAAVVSPSKWKPD